MEIEIWKDIPGYDGRYQASTFGRIKSVNSLTGRPDVIMSENSFNPAGYKVVNLRKDGKRKTFFIHRLVALTFLENPFSLPIVNHKNEIKTDNRVSNLEWCDCRYNNSYGSRMLCQTEKLGKPVVCVERGLEFRSIGEAARAFGLHYQNISRCLKYPNRTAGGFHWRLLD